jgi:predicted lipid-binding transport protein (Tim44 family)
MQRSSKIRYVSLGSNGGGPDGPQPPGGLFGRIIAVIIGAVLFGIAVFLGAIFLAGFVGLLIIGSVIFMLRIWWIKRKMERYSKENGDLDAEYTVIRESDPRK